MPKTRPTVMIKISRMPYRNHLPMQYLEVEARETASQYIAIVEGRELHFSKQTKHIVGLSRNSDDWFYTWRLADQR